MCLVLACQTFEQIGRIDVVFHVGSELIDSSSDSVSGDRRYWVNELCRCSGDE